MVDKNSPHREEIPLQDKVAEDILKITTEHLEQLIKEKREEEEWKAQ